ncbi:MAG: hypothetical protein HYX67_16180 [Candidatus Melainabacteria bacterium]|nr:hypothetical protein [Candidatus Melainabacteria bacterium]
MHKSIDERHSDDTDSALEATNEFKIASFLDSIFYFRDLWTTIGYKSFFTVWTAKTSATFLKPRIDYADVDEPPGPVETRFKTLDLVVEHAQATKFFDGVLKPDKTTNKLELFQPHLAWFQETAKSTVPEAVRSQFLIVHVRENPVILKKCLSEDELQGLDKVSETAVSLWRKAGCRALFVGKDFEPEDYLDGCHLSGSGGAKLAEAVSLNIAGKPSQPDRPKEAP